MQEQEQVQSIVEQVLQDKDLYLVDIELKGSQANRIIWIYVEAEKGNISLDLCADLSREMNFLLDANGWHNRKYTLNVSSPGLDRPLKDIRQYVNNKGRRVLVVYNMNNEQVQVNGIISEADTEIVILETDKNNRLEIPFSSITEARIQPAFK